MTARRQELGKKASGILILLLTICSSVLAEVAHTSNNISITGMVYYSTTPLDGIWVELYPGNNSINSTSLPIQGTRSVKGYYAFHNVAPGQYNIFARSTSLELLSETVMLDIQGNTTWDFYLSKPMTVYASRESETTDLRPTLSWAANNEAVIYYVGVYVADSYGLVEDGESLSTSYTVQKDLTPGIRYQWHIQANDVLGHPVGVFGDYYFTILKPERDLSVFRDSSIDVLSSTINATVHNLGSINESNITVRFFLNGTPIAARTDLSLKNCSSTNLSFALPSSISGSYNVTILVDPKAGEHSYENNRLAQLVTFYASSFDGSDDWPMFMHDHEHTSISSSVAPETGNLLWKYQTGSEVRSSPAIAYGKVYFGSDDCRFYCLNASTGAKIWSYLTNGRVRSSPALFDGKVYFGSDDHQIYCLNAFTGEKVWSFETGDSVYSSPTIKDGKLFCGSNDYNVYCLNSHTGQKIWSYRTGGKVMSSPAVSVDHTQASYASMLYVGSNDNKVYCFNVYGDESWSYDTGDDVKSSCAIVQETALGRVEYVGSGTRVYCLDAWPEGPLGYQIGGWTESSPAAFENRVCIGSNDSYIYCFNNFIRDTIWRFKTDGPVTCSPAIADGKAYIGSDDGSVYSLSLSSGSKIWSYKTGGNVKSCAIAYNTLYFGSTDSYLYAYGKASVTIPTNITCSVLPSIICRGDNALISGYITPNVSNQTITVTYTNPIGQTYSTICTTDSDSSYNHIRSLDMSGKWNVTVSWIGDTSHNGCSYSRTFNVDNASLGTTLTIKLDSPATYLITDPQGRSLGTDPRTHQTMSQIPDASTDGSSLQIIVIKNPLNGTYSIQLFEATGSYSIEIQLVTPLAKSAKNSTGSISAGETQAFRANVSGNMLMLQELEDLPWILYTALTVVVLSAGIVLLMGWRYHREKSFYTNDSGTVVY